jgi:drug/metabolite transporter (DMT)-like permease
MFIPPYIWIALVVAFLWGVHPIIGKQVLNKFGIISTLTFTSLFYFLATLFLASMNSKEVIQDFQRINRHDILLLFSMSVLCTFFATILYYFVLKSHESSIVSALVYSSPIFTLIVAYFLLREKLNGFGIMGILLIVAGVISIAYNDGTYAMENFY